MVPPLCWGLVPLGLLRRAAGPGLRHALCGASPRGAFRNLGGSLLAPLHLPNPQPHGGACAASGLSGGTGEGDIWGVGSLACVLGPGSWEAPGTLATAGLELAETCREVWSLPEASATAPASATPNGTFGPWRVQVFGLFSLSPRGLPVLRKIPL